MPQPIQLRRSTATLVPPAAPAGEPSVLLGASNTKLWISDGTANRLLLSSDPADNPVATTKAYVDAQVVLTRQYIDAAIVVSDTPPAGARVNTLWVDSTTMKLMCRYNDGNSTQWVQLT